MWSKSTVIKLLKLKLVDVYFLVLITLANQGLIMTQWKRYVKGYLELNDSILCAVLYSWQAGSNDSLVHQFFWSQTTSQSCQLIKTVQFI